MHKYWSVMLLLACARIACAVEYEVLVYDGVEYKIPPGELKWAQDTVKRRGSDKDDCHRSLKICESAVVHDELIELNEDQSRPKEISDRIYGRIRGFGKLEYLSIADNRYAVSASVRDYGSAEIKKNVVTLTSKCRNEIQKFTLVYHEEYLYLVEEADLKKISKNVSSRNVILMGCFGCKVDDPKRMVDFQLPPQNPAGTKPGEECEIDGVKLCWCPAGKFTMGSPADEAERREDEKQVEVRLTRGFWIGKYEVTQAQWRRRFLEFPDHQPTKQWGLGDDYPVYWVNSAEAEKYCQKLTEFAHWTGELPANWEFRLPTEAQWEYACRAGTTKATSFGDTLSSKQANIDGTKPYNGGEAGAKPTGSVKVGSYPGNAWNIHDMHGNVFEWTRDWYHTALPGGDDPEATTRGERNRDGTYSRVRRGGAWCEEGKFCRAAFRLRYEPERRSDHIGFRVVAVEVKP